MYERADVVERSGRSTLEILFVYTAGNGRFVVQERAALAAAWRPCVDSGDRHDAFLRQKSDSISKISP